MIYEKNQNLFRKATNKSCNEQIKSFKKLISLNLILFAVQRGIYKFTSICQQKEK